VFLIIQISRVPCLFNAPFYLRGCEAILFLDEVGRLFDPFGSIYFPNRVDREKIVAKILERSG
jgi:hypothetical protein